MERSIYVVRFVRKGARDPETFRAFSDYDVARAAALIGVTIPEVCATMVEEVPFDSTVPEGKAAPLSAPSLN